MRQYIPKVTEQHNFTDCGLYLLKYVEQFCISPPTNFESLTALNQSMGPFWVSKVDIVSMRDRIKDAILFNSKEMQAAKSASPPKPVVPKTESSMIRVFNFHTQLSEDSLPPDPTPATQPSLPEKKGSDSKEEMSIDLEEIQV
uniref:Ubiquitin-like protease family profile domain-containing protein n=1 Tax=Arcella intermedia TaxID=1963864 RepID=A0A6B2LJZ1_9EUKA